MNILLAAARRSPYTGESISAPFQGLLSLAAVLRSGTFHHTAGVHVSVVDDQLEALKNPLEPRGSWITRYQPDIFGVQVSTSSLKTGVDLLRQARGRFPGILTVLGGPGVARSPESLLLDGSVDAIVRGEGEVVFSELVCAYGSKGRSGLPGVRGLIYRSDDGMVVHTPMPHPIQNLDALPFPARDLIDIGTYRRISRGRAGNLITSRGCSYACAYCYSKHQWGIGQRRFSVDRVIEEIRVMVSDYKLDRIRIEDDDFLEDRQWVTEFCTRLIALKLNSRIEWEAKARPDHINSETISLMRKSGCFRLLMGVETLDPKRLAQLRRPLRVSVLQRALELLRQRGVGVQATVILGLPGESDQAMRHTLNWLDRRLDGEHDITSPCFFVPFYSEIADALRQKWNFTIDVEDSDFYTGHVPVVSSPSCSREELQLLYEDMKVDRRGMYERVAHLAQEDEVFRRMGSVW